MSDKTILEQWRSIAYDETKDRGTLQRFWANYFNIEKGIYEQLLTNPDEVVTGTVKELAEKYGQEVLTMVGFLDGINDSLKIPNPIETMDENSKVSLCFDKELLYKNMVDARVLISLTETGEKAYHHHKDFHEKMVLAVLKGLNVEETEALTTALTKLQEFFRNYQV